MNIKALFKSLLLRKFAVSLLVLQLALTLGLIVNSAILAFDTLEKLNKPMGIDLENILVVEHSPTSGAFKKDDYAMSIFEEDIHKLSQIPGVISVAPSIQLPIQSGGTNGNFYDLDDPEIYQRDGLLKYVPYFFSTPELQKVLELEVVEGRLLGLSDMYDGMSDSINILITQSLKNTLYGDESAIGQQTNNGIIVGVVKDINISPTRNADKQYGVFKPYVIPNSAYYLIRVEEGQLQRVKQQVEDVILGVQPERDIIDMYSMADHLNQFYGQDRGLANLFIMLCGLMLFVTIISSYANAQFHISKQKKYIGIRRALGATRKDVMIYVLSENWLICLLGCLVGTLAIYGVNIALSQQVTLSKPDGLLYFAALLVVFLAGTLATWLPAYKTSRIPPVIATRTV